TVIMERCNVGTPHEMVTMYHPNGKTVTMTHYCMLGNQPQLTLTKSDNKTMSFEMKGTQGIHSKNEMHMHAMNLQWISDKEIVQEWTGYDKGKKKDTAI